MDLSSQSTVCSQQSGASWRVVTDGDGNLSKNCRRKLYAAFRTWKEDGPPTLTFLWHKQMKDRTGKDLYR